MGAGSYLLFLFGRMGFHELGLRIHKEKEQKTRIGLRQPLGRWDLCSDLAKICATSGN